MNASQYSLVPGGEIMEMYQGYFMSFSWRRLWGMEVGLSMLLWIGDPITKAMSLHVYTMGYKNWKYWRYIEILYIYIFCLYKLTEIFFYIFFVFLMHNPKQSFQMVRTVIFEFLLRILEINSHFTGKIYYPGVWLIYHAPFHILGRIDGFPFSFSLLILYLYLRYLYESGFANTYQETTTLHVFSTFW